jgi:hypothetical protein
MFTVYSEKDIFENIVVFNNETPNWYNVLCKHSDVCLNITDEELEAEEVEGTPIFEFIKATGGRSVVALKDYFNEIYQNPEIKAEKPRSAFLLNYSLEEAATHQNDYGVIVQGNLGIDDSVLRGTFYKELPNATVLDSAGRIGWHNLANFPLPPSNAMVITDQYLFSNEENGSNVGEANLIQLIDSLLPPSLLVSYHICIVANDQPEVGKAAKSEQWCNALAHRLKVAITALRPYPILVELVFTKTLHKRRLLTNYLNGSCDKGFGVFKIADRRIVRADNDFRCDRIFNRINPSEGDTDYSSVETALVLLKAKCQSVKTFVNNAGQALQNRILGDCRPDNSIVNRLINDV